MERILVTLFILLASLSSLAQTTAKFDKFKNRTLFMTAQTPTGKVTFGEENASALMRKMNMGVGFSCEGQVDDCTPASIELLFVASTTDWSFQGHHDVNLLIDGKPLTAGKSDHDGTVNSGSDLTEYVDTNITPEVLIAMAKAKTAVEVQIGQFEFPLTYKNLL